MQRRLSSASRVVTDWRRKAILRSLSSERVGGMAAGEDVLEHREIFEDGGRLECAR